MAPLPKLSSLRAVVFCALLAVDATDIASDSGGCQRKTDAIDMAIVSQGPYCPKGYDQPRTIEECSAAAGKASGDDEADEECNKEGDLMCSILSHEDNRAMFVPEAQCELPGIDVQEYKAICVPCVNSSYTCEVQEDSGICGSPGLHAFEVAVAVVFFAVFACLLCYIYSSGKAQLMIARSSEGRYMLIHFVFLVSSFVYLLWLLIVLQTVKLKGNQSGFRYQATIDSFMWVVLRIVVAAFFAGLAFRTGVEDKVYNCCLCASDSVCVSCLVTEMLVALVVCFAISFGVFGEEKEKGVPLVHSADFGAGAAILAAFVVLADIVQIVLCVCAIIIAFRRFRSCQVPIPSVAGTVVGAGDSVVGTVVGVAGQASSQQFNEKEMPCVVVGVPSAALQSPKGSKVT